MGKDIPRIEKKLDEIFSKKEEVYRLQENLKTRLRKLDEQFERWLRKL